MFWIMLLGCTDVEISHTYDTTPEDTGTPWPDDTDAGTDEDKDGWSVEEGDCDDDDIYVHPGWDEDPSDGKDNDCDGRIDEQFSGVTVLELQDCATTPASIITLDSLGFEVGRVTLDDPAVCPYFLTEVSSGWVVADLNTSTLVEVSPTGMTSLLADFSLYEYGLWGVNTDREGNVVTTTGDALHKVDLQGNVTLLASWDIETEIVGFDVAVDTLTGEIAVFGYYGSLLTQLPGEAAVLQRTFDPENIEFQIWSGAHKDGGGWYMGGFDVDGFGVFRWDAAQGTWQRKVTWTEDWSPHFMAINGDSGDYFITTEGGQFPYVWHIDSGAAATISRFYPEADKHQPGVSYWDLYILY